MKKIFLLLSVIVFSVATTGFTSPDKEKDKLKKIVRKYRSKGESTKISIPPGLINIFVDKDEEPELKKLLKDLSDIDIFVLEEKAVIKDFSRDVDNALKNKSWKELMVVNSSEEKVQIKIRKKRKKVSQLIIFVSEEDSAVLIKLKGKIDPAKWSEYAKLAKQK